MVILTHFGISNVVRKLCFGMTVKYFLKPHKSFRRSSSETFRYKLRDAYNFHMRKRILIKFNFLSKYFPSPH